MNDRRMDNGPTRGTGMLAMFVDLEPKWHQEFREWLTRDMFAARLKIGFHACASYDLIDAEVSSAPAAQQFLTVYEMTTLGDLYGEPYQGLRRVRDPLDAAFHERFQRPDRYTLSWTGPEISGGPLGFAPVIVVDRFNLSPETAQQFNIWFTTEYLPACIKFPGLLRVRRYLSMEGQPSHFVFHEFENEDGPSARPWTDLRTTKHWSLTTPHLGTAAAYRLSVSAP